MNRAHAGEADLAYQRQILEGVSRTFALTIPQLPEPLCAAVGNAYLLCRIADTIEDDADLDWPAKAAYCEQFIAVMEGQASAADFAAELAPALASQTLAAERDLVSHTARVIAVTHSFNEVQQQAMRRCVRIMSRGMAMFQSKASSAGLESIEELDQYCYHVAGVVGEMLTELFCDYDRDIAVNRQQMMNLAVSFGQGLQMTNILKDVWDDHQRGVCWFPRDVFADYGCDLSEIRPGIADSGFRSGLFDLIGIARLHLGNALQYTLLIPDREAGIRKFCLWALGMAVLTLRKLHSNPDFGTGDEVKIGRNSVRATVLATSLLVRRDAMLRGLFSSLTRSLPECKQIPAAVSV